MMLPNCNDLLGILLASKKLAHGARRTTHGARRTGARRGMLLSAHEIRYFCALGSRRTTFGAWPTVGNVGFSTQNRNIFCLRTAQVAWEPIKTDKTSFLLAHKSLDCVTFIFGFQQFYTCWTSEETIFRQKFGNFFGESCLLKFARRTALGARRTRMLLFGSLQLGKIGEMLQRFFKLLYFCDFCPFSYW